MREYPWRFDADINGLVTLGFNGGHPAAESDMRKALADMPAGKSVDGRLKGGISPLMAASWLLRPRLMGLLLAAGADAHARDAFGRSAEMVGHRAGLKPPLAPFLRETRDECRALVAACADPSDAPEGYRVRVISPGAMNEADLAARDRADDLLAASLGFWPEWAARRRGGMIWLKSSEVGRARVALSRAVTDRTTFELTPARDAPGGAGR